jgi:DNA-binding transcriptional ArsR family regulator
VLAKGASWWVYDLASVLERAENTVSQHLWLLRAAGLATSRRDGTMVMYSLTERGSDLLQAVAADAVAAR